MKKYGIEMEGPFIAEKVSSLPTWTSNDEGRVVYDETTKVIYYGDDSGWIEASKPAGTIEMFAGLPGSIPSGYLLCDGSVLSTTTYARLFAAIGYIWGGGGASFNLPDMAQKGPYGPGGGRSVGDTDGAETVDISHDHTIASEANHDHLYSGATDNDTSALKDQGSGSNSNTPRHNHTITNQTTDPGGAHDHGGATGSGGSGTQDILNPIAVVTFIIKY